MIPYFIVAHLHVYNKLLEQTQVSVSADFWSGFLPSKNESISGQSFLELYELYPH